MTLRLPERSFAVFGILEAVRVVPSQIRTSYQSAESEADVGICTRRASVEVGNLMVAPRGKKQAPAKDMNG